MGDQQERSSWLAFLGGVAVGEGSFVLNISYQFRPDGRGGYKRGKLKVEPRYLVGMTDIETMEYQSSLMKALELPHHFWRSDKREYASIAVVGLKRMARFLPEIMPYLTGKKRQAAEVVREYIEYRLSLPPRSSVGSRDADFVNRIRAINNQPNNNRAKSTDILRGHMLRPAP